MGYGAQVGIILIDPATNEPYKAGVTLNTVEGDLDTELLAKEAKQDAEIAAIQAVDSTLQGTLDVNITNASSPLPAGAATASNQMAEVAAINDVTAALGETLTVAPSGTFPVSATALPLPTGAATESTLSGVLAAVSGTQTVNIANTPIPVTDNGSSLTVDGSVQITNASIPVTDNGGSITIDATSLPLPTGAATAANQVETNNALAGTLSVAVTNPSIAVTQTSQPLPAGAATESTLSAVNTKITTGSQTKATSLTVGLADDQVVETSVKQVITTGQALATPVNSVVTVAVGDTQTMLVAVRSGGVAGGVISFEVTQDGTNWVSIAGRSTQAIVAAGALATPTLAANTTYSYVFSTAGWASFRTRVTTVLGSGATIGFGATSASSDPTVLVSGTVAISGTVTTTVSGTATTTPQVGSSFLLSSAASTNATLVKNAAGNLYELTVSNTSASTAYVKFHNSNAAPTVGTTAVLFTVPVPASSIVQMDWGALGKRFPNGISYSMTANVGAGDTNAVLAGVQISGTFA